MKRRPSAGFTLIELMITVTIIGILAAIAIPSFLGYIKRSKSTEATTNLRNLFQGAAAYYERETWGDRMVTLVTGTSIATISCVVGNAITSAPPSSSKSVLDWSMEAPEFGAIGFVTRDPTYYQYAIAGSDGACGHMENEALYSFRAYGDLDGDTETSLYELAAGSDTQNELIRAPGVYRVDPWE